jgi:hypothetical protein
MMTIERLGKAARGDRPPTVEVSGRVMAGLASGAVEDDKAMNWIMALSAAAAVVLLIALFPLYREWSDPVTTVVANLSWSLL